MNNTFKGAVLLIGSLFWEDDLKKNDKIRKKWRSNSLHMEKAILSKLPIRYGRYSKDGIYTMVLSMNCIKNNNLGLGYVIPFSNNPLVDIKDLIKEAIELSKAEGMNGKFVGGSSVKWSTLAILFNNNKINMELKNSILTEWEKNVRNDGGSKDYKDYCFGKEKSCLSSKGELLIKWPIPLNTKDFANIDELDFLLAAVTKPQHESEKRYPSISEIANSVNKDSTRKYFKNNVSHRITTFQDIRILNKINGESK